MNTIKKDIVTTTLLPFVVVTFATLSSEIYARDEDADIKKIRLEEITVVGKAESAYKTNKMSSHKYSQPLVNTPKTVFVIPRSVMDDRGVTNLEEGLTGIPGITFAAGEGGRPPGDSLRIRGFEATQDIFVDGIRDIAGYKRHTYNIESIEVAKGPGSSVSGRGSTGGSVNLQSKRAELEQFSKARASIAKEGYSITLDSNNVINDTSAVRINILSEDLKVAGRDEVKNAMNAIAASYTYGLDTDTRITLAAEYQKQDNIPDYGIVGVYRADRTPDSLARYIGKAAPVSFSNFYGNVNRDFEDIEATKFTGVFEKDLTKDSSIFIQTRQGTVKRNHIVSVHGLFADTDLQDADNKNEDKNNKYIEAARHDARTMDRETTIIALQAAYIAKVYKHNFSVGAEYSLEKEKSWYFGSDNDNLFGRPNNLYNPDPKKSFTGSYNRGGLDATGEGTSLALYGFDTYTINEDWDLSAGLRFEKYKTKTKDRLNRDGTARATVLEGSRTDNMLSWNFSIVNKTLQKDGTVYFSMGKSFNPSAEDLTGRLSYEGRTYNEYDLDPEESLSYELGAKREFADKKLLVSAAIFRTDKTNMRSDDPLLDSREDTLNGEARVDGVELGIVGQLTPKIELTAGYTYQKSKILKATGDDAYSVGRELDNTPQHSLSVWANFKPTYDITAGIGLQYVGERYGRIRETYETKQPSYTVIDLAASKKINHDLSLRFNAKNITNKRYISKIGSSRLVPGAGRSVSLTLDYDF
ncbi:MAG: TonB-dependent siderophore receptor [Methylococcales symbiont of Hymedesmia sp. n. MRB-2018]|nr:MAG: TonB-dependent siderophore receptor [Methylococcales symbiont of Hymedesmia sp. n. MRB-2018]